MEFTYENQGGSTLLVWKLPAAVKVDEMIKGMVENNEIRGLLPLVFVQKDLERYAKYNISSKVTLRQYLSGMIQKKKFLTTMLGLANTVLEAEDYMISQGNLLFDLDYIYADVRSGQIGMVVLPVIQQGHAWDLGQFFRNLLFGVQFDTRENGNYIAEILNFLNSGATFSILEFKKLLEKQEKTAETVKRNSAVGFEGIPLQAGGYTVGQEAGVQIPGQSMAEQPVSGLSGSENTAVSQLSGGTQVAGGMQIPSQPSSGMQNPGQSLRGMQVSSQPSNGMQNPGQPSNGMQIPGQSSGGMQIPGQLPDGMQIPGQPLDGMQIPGQISAQKGGTAKETEEEKPISMFYLLQHYNKETAAAYKAQKEAKKEAKNLAKNSEAMTNVSSGKPEKHKKQKKEKKKKNRQEPGGFAVPEPGSGFTVPGQREGAGSGFAVPDQGNGAGSGFAVPDQGNGVGSGFAVPGQGNASAKSPAGNPGGGYPSVPSQNFGKENPGILVQAQEPSGFIQPSFSQAAGFADFGETNYFPEYNDESDTTEMWGMEGEAQRVAPHLIRKKNGEKILLDREVFHLGRDVSYNDYPIVDNKYVGHSHCHIITRDGGYFIVDDNSKNHTYANEVLVMPGSEVKLSHGQSIRLANEEFEFRLF